MTKAFEWLGEVTGLGWPTTRALLVTFAIILAAWLIRWIWIALANRRTEDPRIRYRWRKVATYSMTMVAVVAVARVWLEGVQDLVTYLGLVSAGIAVALRDPIVNWFGWIFIGWRRPFTVGDRIAIGGISGDVIDIGVSTFSILEVSPSEFGEQSTGRIVHIPNGKIFAEPLGNITQGFDYLWNEMDITVTFESDWRQAKSLLETILMDHVESVTSEAAKFIREASRKFLIHSANLRPRVYTKIVEDGVCLSMRYICQARSRRITQEAVSEAILDAFAQEPRIDFAYRTSRIFRQTEEGKPGLLREREIAS